MLEIVITKDTAAQLSQFIIHSQQNKKRTHHSNSKNNTMRQNRNKKHKNKQRLQLNGHSFTTE
jgi:hypothetical protein